MNAATLLQPRFLAHAAAIAALCVMAALALHWRPARQVQLHQEHLLLAVENRSWKKVGALLAADYRDRWDQSKPIVLERLPQVFGDFLACGILSSEPSAEWSGPDCTIRTHIRIVGTGGPIAQAAMQESERLTEPFAFTWRRQSWKPWDWALITVDQPQIEIPGDAF